jgi:hypothetical protein
LTFEIFKELCFRLEQTSAAYKALIVQHAAAHRSAAGPGGNPAKRLARVSDDFDPQEPDDVGGLPEADFHAPQFLNSCQRP